MMMSCFSILVLATIAATSVEAFSPLLSTPPPRASSTELHGTPQKVAAALMGATLAIGSLLPLPAVADASRVVGSISGSGLVFKDTLQIEAFPDPKVEGVHLYISNFQIPVTERISKAKFFSDPSDASVACARGKDIKVADTIARGPAGEEVFKENKNLLFKSLRVQRIYDEETNTIIYVSFNTRLDTSGDSNKSRFKSSLCAIGLD